MPSVMPSNVTVETRCDRDQSLLSKKEVPVAEAMRVEAARASGEIKPLFEATLRTASGEERTVRYHNLSKRSLRAIEAAFEKASPVTRKRRARKARAATDASATPVATA